MSFTYLDPYVTRLPDYHLFLLLFMQPALERGSLAMPVEEFVTQDDLDNYLKALAWWPKDAPIMLQAPSLEVLAQSITYTPPMESITFSTALLRRSKAIVEWLESENRSVQFPNETKDERRKRMTAERVRALRERQKAPPTPERLEAIKLAEDRLDKAKADKVAATAYYKAKMAEAKAYVIALGEERRLNLEAVSNVVTQAREAVKLAKSA